MRVARLLSSPMTIAALCVVACGGSAPPAEAPAEARVATPTAATAASADAEPPTSNDPEVGADDTKSASADDTPRASDQSPSDQPSKGPKGPETRTMDVIRKLVMDNRKAARKCYEDARLSSKDLQGNVVIHFVLDPEGKVKSAVLNQERSTLKAPAVVDCVIGVIKGISFPKSSRAMETTANYPFNFTP
jgi:hypothetical protein